MKIAIVTDSNSGITQKQAQELGVFVLAMPFQIDGETYYEDITLTQEEFYKKLREGDAGGEKGVLSAISGAHHGGGILKDHVL